MTARLDPSGIRRQTSGNGFSGLRSFVARHALAFLVAVALGALLVFPRWWMLTTQPPTGDRVPVTVWGASDMGSDEALEATTIRDAYDGLLPVRAPHLVNHRNDSLQAGAGWQEFIGIAGRAVGDPFRGLAVVTSIMAVAAFLTLYALAYGLTSSRLAAAAVLPLAALLAQVFFHLDHYATREQWRYLAPLFTLDPEREFLAWTRFLAPVMVLAPLFTVALALPRAAATGDRRWSAAATAALALLIYSYVYYWTAAGLAMALWLAVLVYQRELDAARRVLIIGVVAVIIALPELAIVANKSLTSNADIQARLGQGSPDIVWGERSRILERLVIGFPFLYMLRRRTVEHGFLVALFVAPLILVAISGVMPQPWHYRSQVWTSLAIPAFIAGGAQLYLMLSESRRLVAYRALAAVAAVVLIYLVALQIRATADVNDAYALSNDEYAAFQWIDANVGTHETVATPSIVTTLLVDNLTPAAGYIIGGYNPVATDDELIDRYLRVQAAFGYDEQSTFARLDPNNGFPFEHKVPASRLEREVEQHIAFYTFYWEVTTPDRIERRIPAWRERFQHIAPQDDVIAAWPVDYLYCGPRERFWPVVSPPRGIFVRPAFESGSVTLYRVTDASDARAKPFEGC